MEQFIFAGYDSNGNLAVKGINLSMTSYQRDFDCSDNDKAKAALGIAMVEDQTRESAFIDLRDKRINFDSLTQLHFHTMGKMYNDVLNVPADTPFKSSYIAYALSIFTPDRYFLSNQAICRNTGMFLGGAVSEFKTLQEGKRLRLNYIDENELGASTDLGGEVYRNGAFVGYFSYGGRLWDDVFYGGRGKPKEIDDFLNSDESPSQNAFF